MKRKAIYIILTVSSVLMTSCFDEQFEDKSFSGALFEFNNTTTDSDPLQTTKELSDGAGQFTEQVNLVGPQFSSDQTVRFTVDADLTTAIAGTHYDLMGGTFVFPANSSVADLMINILDASLASDESVDLVLLLEGTSDVKPSENYKRLYLKILGEE